MPDFTTLDYLREGNARQREAYRLLSEKEIIATLSDFSPVLTGTIPIGIHLPESDLDIACVFTDRESFVSKLNESFHTCENYRLKIRYIRDQESVIARFTLEDQHLEIFGQERPVEEQESYRHMLIEYRILEEKGEDFRQEVMALKRSGIKTEPAFARLLGLGGDPYLELLIYGDRKDPPI